MPLPSPQPPPPARRRGFTLIELLIVIVIVAILVAMLMPVIAMVRGQALSVACLSNLRQVATAHIAYSNDYNGIVPWPPYGTAPDPVKFANYMASSNLVWWNGQASADTARSAGGHVWSCPLMSLNSQGGFPWSMMYYMNWRALEPYSYPANGAPDYQNPHKQRGYRMQTLVNPTEAAICGDMDGGGGGGYMRGRTNLAFLDGHAAGMDDDSRTNPSTMYYLADPGTCAFARYFSDWTSSSGNLPMLGYDH